MAITQELNVDNQPTITNCDSCGIHKSCKNPYLRPVVDVRPETADKNCLLVVGDYTDSLDDKHAGYFNSNGRGYKYVEHILNHLECRYVFTTSLACGITSRDMKLGVKHYRACFEEKLKPLILKYKPKAILFLGRTAMNAGLQHRAPKSMKDITLSGMKVSWTEEHDEEINSLVIALDHPSQFNMERTDKVRLEKLYRTVFGKAEQFCLNSDKRLPVEYELIDTPAKLYTLARDANKLIAFDVENSHSDKDINKNTIWKSGVKCLSLAITEYNERHNYYKNYVIVGKPLEDKLLIEKLFRGRHVVAHNISHDAQVVHNQLGVDIWPLVADYEDTMAMFYLSDQNRLDNGLKPLSANYLGIYDYVDDVKRYVTEANARISALRKNLNLTIKEKIKHLKWYEEALSYKRGEYKFSAAKIKNLEKILNIYSSADELHSILHILREELAELPAEGSADYGDIPISVLAAYNAEDTFCTLKLFREILPFLSKHDKTFNRQDPLWTDEAYLLYKRSVKMASIVSRNGMPLDMESLDKMNDDLIAREAEVKNSLLGRPEIEEALLSIPIIKKKADKGILTDTIKLKEISPTKAKFITALCKNLKLHRFAVLTKGNNWSFTSKKCIQSIKDHFESIGDTNLSKLFGAFEYIGNNRQVRNKFIKNWKKYYVYKDKCFHPDFKLTKNQSIAYANKEADGGANGRTASSNPNMQQIRKVGYLRKHFKARKGFKFVEIDYCQLEVYTIAFLSNCLKLKETFKRGLDIYQVIANEIYNKGVDVDDPDVEKVKAELEKAVPKKGKLRGIVKVGFLAWAYGNGKKAFGERLGLTPEEVDHFYSNSESQFREVFEWKKGITECIVNGEPITTPFGRLRTAPIRPPIKGDKDDYFRYKKELNKTERVLVNFGPQSLGADICLWMACNITDWIIKNGLENVVRIVNLVHDSLWFEVAEDRCEELIPFLQSMMEDVSTLPFKFDIPLKTEADSGYSLADYIGKTEMDLTYVM